MIKRVASDPAWPLPSWGSPSAAGLDLAACLDEPVTIEAGAVRLIPTGWAVAIPEGYEGQVRPRSGAALKRGLTLINSPGTIDSDYRGEIGLAVINLGREAAVISRGERLAQLVVSRVFRPELAVIEVLSQTQRGEGGFGSTGAGTGPSPEK
ncbi:MAG: dUTP diphosphatase [Deltaproteobacteria bacterium]|jgi:dUTP pyrophosphatase|nr:dUTP diphosphatase [Deltaproteobacteria bacterium]